MMGSSSFIYLHGRPTMGSVHILLCTEISSYHSYLIGNHDKQSQLHMAVIIMVIIFLSSPII